MQEVFGDENLITNTGELKVADLSKNKVIGLYFTAHWCPPCRTFTPRLIQLYKNANSRSKVIEIVFISFDRDSETMNNYFEEMPWAAVPYSNKALCENLGDVFGVTGIPALIIIKSNGQVISRDGRSDVHSKNSEVVDYWIKKAENPNADEEPESQSLDTEVEESTFARDPIEGLVCDKNHYLIWQGDVGKFYNETSGNPGIKCDFCKASLRRSSWHCRECRFDLCKDCRDWLVDSKKFNNLHLRCWASHYLLMSERLKEFYYKKFGVDKYTCRSCNNVQTGTNLHCRRCFFDVCQNCQNTIITYAPLANRVLCGKGHGLVWTPDLCMKYQTTYGAPKYRCDICTRAYQGSGSFNCFTCTYDVCIQCIAHAVQSTGN
ncbi:hypothetical protein SteCoe_25515 [Stentor coeruleus]|uniref:Thioredoxin domain-containing protein n=1 Tax=Stentor coeruleus TaxID=5963 RepID=A0A1R2BF36_9CILI|nr:hypothetical protein SteCoe_25515 [Stentor coeruleus]